MRSRVLAIAAAVAVGVGGLTLGSARPAQAAPTVVPDSAFAACLNTSKIGQPATAPITAAQLASLSGMVGCGPEVGSIASLEGAQYLTGITELGLSATLVTDLRPLAGLTNLTSLTVSGSEASDVSPLAGLTGLTSLTLMSTAVSDLRPLAGMTGLSTLMLGSNRITDVSPLAGMINLMYLDLHDNPLSDLRPLAGLTGVGTLYLENDRISDVAPLAGMTGLVVLYLDNNQISDPAPLAGLTGLKTLSLDNNPIRDLSSLAGIYQVVGHPMYRLFNPITGEHFYTAVLTEAADDVMRFGWRSEGIGWYAPPVGVGVPVYRLAAIPGTGSAGHLFTTSQGEKDKAMATGQWTDEGIGWYSAGPESVLRQYQPTTGQHNYTSDANEIKVITTEQGWQLELDGTAAWNGLVAGEPADNSVGQWIAGFCAFNPQAPGCMAA